MLNRSTRVKEMSSLETEHALSRNIYCSLMHQRRQMKIHPHVTESVVLKQTVCIGSSFCYM